MDDGIHSGITDKIPKGTLGTFAGVFTPSIMTILGIILFLRLGYVVGSAGIRRALVIILVANIICVLTSFSLSAVATNLKVKGGGDYYLISRTLGVEFGGALGIVLFLAQSVSIAFYCIGFGEAFSSILHETLTLSPQVIAAVAVSCLFVFAWLGADWATRFQYGVMTLLIFALCSFFWGGFSKWDATLFNQNWVASTDGPSFWGIFAIFFPAVTGFTQGVSMSGDLRDPGRSLPLGTFFAVGLSIVIYFLVAMVFAGTVPNEVMSQDYKSMWRVARYSVLIDAGVIAATLSSAMASFLGAPRILQSLSADRIFPVLSYFSKGYGASNNPRPAVLLSLVIAYLTIAMGNLNIIAPVVSMFFLISYGLLNYATFYEARSASPSFRPGFRWFDYRLSLLGFIACLGVMLAIDMTAGIVALSVLFAIFQYLKRTAGPARWADSRRSHHLQQVRENLLAAYGEVEHPRDWRPQLLAISDDPERRKQLLQFGSWIQGGSGLMTAVRIMEGEGLKLLRQKEESEETLRKEISSLGVQAFPRVLLAPGFEVGLHTLIQAYGIGPIRPNTILLDFQDEFSKDIPSLKKIIHIQNLQTIFRLKCNIVVLNVGTKGLKVLEDIPLERRRIDVWWWNDTTSHLMLLLAYLMTRSETWSEATIRVIAACYDKQSKGNIEDLEQTLDEIRIEAEPIILENATAASISQYSVDAAMVFLPFRLRGRQISAPFNADVEELLSEFNLSVMVLAAEDIDLDAQPEEGRPQQIAEALDALEEALRRSRETERNAEKAAKAAEAAEKKLNDLLAAAGPGVGREVMERIEQAARAADAAKERAEKAARKAASAQVKAQQVAHETEALGVGPIKEDEKTTESTESE